MLLCIHTLWKPCKAVILLVHNSFPERSGSVRVGAQRVQVALQGPRLHAAWSSSGKARLLGCLTLQNQAARPHAGSHIWHGSCSTIPSAQHSDAKQSKRTRVPLHHATSQHHILILGQQRQHPHLLQSPSLYPWKLELEGGGMAPSARRGKRSSMAS